MNCPFNVRTYLCILFSWLAAVEKVDSGEAQDSPGMQDEEDTLGEKYYDKAKCFFDNISSDLKPRWLRSLCYLSGSSCSRISNVFLCVLRRTTWAEEKKLNMETFGVPGRFLRGRGLRGRGRRQSTTEQRPLPKIGSGRVWRLFFLFVFLLTFSVNIVVFYLFKQVPPFFPSWS